MQAYLNPTAPESTVQNYFSASYFADEIKIRECFFHDAVIIGEIANELMQWAVNDLIQRIKEAHEKEKPEVFDKKILNVEKTSKLAIIKARNVVREWVFIDTFILKNENSIWKITAKYFMMADQFINLADM